MIIGNGTIITCVADSVEKLAATVTNNSDTVVKTTVLIKFTFPPGLAAAVTQPAPSQGTFDGVDEWTMPSLAVSTSHTFNLNLVVTDSTEKPWTGADALYYTVTSDQSPDDDPSNDTAFRSFNYTISCEDFNDCNTLGEAHGDVLYVSVDGDNLTAVKGDPHLPWRDPWTAAEAAVSRDTVYVYPGAYIIGDGVGDFPTPDIIWDTTQNLFYSSGSEGYTHWHFDERAVIVSLVDDPTFSLFTINPFFEGSFFTITGAGSFHLKAGTVITGTAEENNIELSAYSTSDANHISNFTDGRDHMFMSGYFEGHTNIKIDSVRTRGPNFLSMFNQRTSSFRNSIKVDIGIWTIDAPFNLDSEADAGTDDAIMAIDNYWGEGIPGKNVPDPMNIVFNIGVLKSIWKAKGLLCNYYIDANGNKILNLSTTFNIESWNHIDALIEDGTPYVIDDDLAPYRTGDITTADHSGAMIYLGSNIGSGLVVDNVKITVNLGTAHLDGMLFDNYDHSLGEAATRNTLVLNSPNHYQTGTPLTVRNGSNENGLGISNITMNVQGFTESVPLHLENPLAADSGPKRYISGIVESIGYMFMRFNDQVVNKALVLKDLLIITDQAAHSGPLTGGDTNEVVVLSTASNVAGDVGMIEKGTPIVVDTNYS